MEEEERIENIAEDMAESSEEETADLEEEIKCTFCLVPLSSADLRCCGCDRILVHAACVRRRIDCDDWRCSRCRDREIVTEMRFNEQRWDEKVFKNLMRVEPWADEGLLIKLRTGEAPGTKIERKNICAKARRYRLNEKNTLFAQKKTKDGMEEMICLHPHQRYDWVLSIHENEAQHFAAKRTLAALHNAKLDWHGISRDVGMIVQTCEICQLDRPVMVPPMSIKPTITTTPFERVAVDLTYTRLPQNQDPPYIGLLNFVDHFTKWIHCYPVFNQSAAEMAPCFLKFLADHQQRIEFTTDGGNEFLGEVQSILDQYGLKCIKTPEGSPQANGLVERANGTICGALRRMMQSERTPRNWAIHLDAVVRAYRSMPQDSTGVSPHELLYAQKPVISHSLLPPPSFETEPTVADLSGHVARLAAKLTPLYQRRNQNVEIASARQVRAFERRRGTAGAAIVYRVGDIVAVRGSRRAGKFTPRWRNGFKIKALGERGQHSVTLIVPERETEKLIYRNVHDIKRLNRHYRG
jgi:hypothetical protein